jgi:integrase
MTKVTLRMKPISGSRQTLYLDYYPAIPHPVTGKLTRREFLKLYTYEKAKTEPDRRHNKETLQLAQAIRAQRQLAVQKGNYGFLSDEKQNTDFTEYFENLAKKRAGSNSENWLSALGYLKNFTEGKSVRFKDVNETFCNDFREYLLTAPSRKSSKVSLSQNSAVSYFNKFKAALKQAFKDGYLEIDLNQRIETIKQSETERQYLTFEELQSLANTECSIPILKQAALFSALTGLRFSDINKLLWSEIQHSSHEGYFIRFRQQKTKGAETLPISEQAFNLLGKRGNHGEAVFQGLEYSFTQTCLPKWLNTARITKACTFHSFRHTYATLQLSFGTDLYTVSKMLGHREIKTTQVYAKIIDKQKREAANKIKLELSI